MHRINAADVTFPASTESPSDAFTVVHDALVVPPRTEVAPDFAGLRAMLKACGRGSSADDRLDALVVALIAGEITSGRRIVGTARHLGFDERHARTRLVGRAGLDPDRFPWRCDGNDTYSLNEPT